LNSIIEFFIVKARLNYTLMVFITLLGIASYMFMPKDVFPPVKLDKIIIAGGYAGTSIDILDKMAVTKLEDELRSLTGVSKMESSVKNSRFTVTLTLEKGSDVEQALNDSKDVISNVKRYFPTDMDEPIAKLMEMNIPIIAVVISSQTETIDDLIKIGKDIKKEFTTIEGVSNVNLYSENDRTLEIRLDTKKIEMFNLNKKLLISELQKFSYIYPAGKIEEKNRMLFISTFNGQRSVEDILNVRMNINGTIIFLKDIAEISKKYKENNVLTRFNGVQNVEMGVFKNENGDAIKLAENVKTRILEISQKYPTIQIDTYNDASKIVRTRLNTVVSNILLGILLVGLSVWIMINGRLAFVVTIGIPTALLIGAFIIYFAGFAINIVTLLGVLLILGVLVDDAVLVAENIQRHIQMGEDKLKASITGTKEVLIPVLASSVTTIFAFIPMLALSGEMGAFLKMIPVAIISLVIASLIESFIFLPLHSYHIFKAGAKELDWTPANKIYHAILGFVVKRSKWLVPIFLIVILGTTFATMKTMKFQLFPEFDSDKMFVRGNFNINYRVEEVAESLKPIEKAILGLKDELNIKSISLLAGYQNTTLGGVVVKQNVFDIFIELEPKTPQNFIDEYITPLLSPNHYGFGERNINVEVIVERLKEELSNIKVEGLEELLIVRDKPKVAKSDIEIQLNSNNDEVLKTAIANLKNEISKIDGIVMLGDDAQEGIKELKLKPNNYGESLGFTEGYFAQILAPYFLEAEMSRGLGDEGIIQIVTRAETLDSLDMLKRFEISTPDGKTHIQLKDVADFKILESFDSLYKVNGVPVKTVFANVNNGIITAGEVLEILEPTMQIIREQGIQIYLKGEREQNDRMKVEMGTALAIAIFMIFMTLLIMFNSFRQTLIILSVIPLSVLGALIGHKIMGMNLSMPSMIGILGLAGVVINNGVVMLEFIRKATNFEDLLHRASLRLRPIIITSLTTFIGLSTLIFFATGQAVILQPISVSLGYGLLWGTVLNLIYLPSLFAMMNYKRLNIKQNIVLEKPII